MLPTMAHEETDHRPPVASPDARADARRDASELGAPASSSSHVALVVFLLDDAEYSLLASAVQEIIHAVAVHALPEAPSIVQGVLNLRGEIVPLLNIRSRLGFPSKPIHPHDHYLIAKTVGRTVALHVDRVRNVLSVERTAIRPPDPILASRHVSGIAMLDSGLIIVQNIDRFLALHELEQIDAALHEARIALA
jgi:purine-binding chemotaxis protein CheW